MFLMTEEDAKEIGEAITRNEKRTSGEIVAVLSSQSGSYRLLPLFIGAFIALLVPLILIYLPLYTQGSYMIWSAERIYFFQLICFVVLSFVFSMRPIRYWIVPGALKRRWAHAHAMEQFAAQEMHTTTGRTGVMIFVSVAERFAEVIGDIGIYEKVPEEEWQKMVSDLVRDIEHKKPKEGFLKAIETSGTWLNKHFPPTSEPLNELSNHLIIIE